MRPILLACAVSLACNLTSPAFAQVSPSKPGTKVVCSYKRYTTIPDEKNEISITVDGVKTFYNDPPLRVPAGYMFIITDIDVKVTFKTNPAPEACTRYFLAVFDDISLVDFIYETPLIFPASRTMPSGMSPMGYFSKSFETGICLKPNAAYGFVISDGSPHLVSPRYESWIRGYYLPVGTSASVSTKSQATN